LKKLLIISPHFPPINAADMHRVRQSVWYFEQFGWKPTVVSVDEQFIENIVEPMLLETQPTGLEIIKVKAFATSWTRKIGLGALALRSLFFYFFAINKLLKQKHFDLVYFSTTQFPLLVLGRYWKWRFKVPYVIDMQDPWHSTYYVNKPKAERPKKYWFSFYLNKWLEPIAMNGVDGLISVSAAYIQELQQRYPVLINKPSSIITFGAFSKDMEVAKKKTVSTVFLKDNHLKYIVYVGRGGFDMQLALALVFAAFKEGLSKQPDIFKQFRFVFIGTSYAPKGKGTKTILPVAEKAGVGNYLTEYTERVAYYEGLSILQNADMLFIPGSDSAAYTASKLYPYILTEKPILGIFHIESSAKKILEDTSAGKTCAIGDEPEIVYDTLSSLLASLVNKTYINTTNWKAFSNYSAASMTKKQVALFNLVASK
ncbi:glycosyltransferase, partial [Parasediminibacterium sp. JCM 36343]|uniref:glycosyltransferase n=1 Tax=Parasediminibacterium sp. JCM 36343 TaxID=3374279 RepID=UPI00397D3374